MKNQISTEVIFFAFLKKKFGTRTACLKIIKIWQIFFLQVFCLLFWQNCFWFLRRQRSVVLADIRFVFAWSHFLLFRNHYFKNIFFCLFKTKATFVTIYLLSILISKTQIAEFLSKKCFSIFLLTCEKQLNNK